LLLLSKDFLSGHFKKVEISFRALKPPQPTTVGRECVPKEFATESRNVFASWKPPLRFRLFQNLKPFAIYGSISEASISIVGDERLKLVQQSLVIGLSAVQSGNMRWVVFLRAVNVGGANRCRPALIAKELAEFGIANIGAVGTFVVRGNVSESALRAAIAKKLSFKCEIMICPARDIIKLASKDPFARQPSGPDITRFVNVLAKRLRTPSRLPLSLPSDDDWLLKIIAIQGRFVLGLYRRQMKTISYLSKIEKMLGVPATTRNWNTIKKVVRILRQNSKEF
jgi:uncharacterized protein (DUF1697 family)